MKTHPIIDYPFRWAPLVAVALVLVVLQVILVHTYTGADLLPSVIDGIATIGWLMAIGYLMWFVVGTVSIFQTLLISLVMGILIWIAGCFMVCDIMTRIFCLPYLSFAMTIPFRLMFGVPTFISILLWYRLIDADESILNQELENQMMIRQMPVNSVEPIELIDRITVKDGSKINLIKTDELICIQACGDYVTLTTPTGEYIKEQTMKYFEAHLPSEISRVELFGKETYQLLLKNGMKIKVSLSGYRILKENLGL